MHIFVLLIPRHAPVVRPAASSLQATLKPAVVVRTLVPENSASPSLSSLPPKKMARSKPVLAVVKTSDHLIQHSVTPRWTRAEKTEMEQFLNELAVVPPGAVPMLAQRSLAMAQELAKQQAQEHLAETAVVERLPNSPPIDPFGLEMYMDALVRKLNRSAGYVRNDPRGQGLRPAAVLVRLNPNGSLNSFRIVNTGDQQEEIRFIRQVVEQAVPFAAFPADIQRSAKTLGLMICIMPARSGGGFGFSRQTDGRGC